MRAPRLLPLAFALAALAVTPALAERRMDLPPHRYTSEHQAATTVSDVRQPYAMTYSDEVAQSLGVESGRWEAFDTGSSDPLMPSLKGGVDHGGAMIRLQWQPGS